MQLICSSNTGSAGLAVGTVFSLRSGQPLLLWVLVSGMDSRVNGAVLSAP